MQIVKWILMILFVVIVLGFALQNQEQTVSIKMIQWTSPVLPVYWFIFASFVLGFLFWLVVSSLNFLRLKSETRKITKENQKLKKELDRLRNLEIDEEITPQATPPEETESLKQTS